MEVEPCVDSIDAFTRIYEETSARVYGVVLRLVRDTALAESVTQEAELDCRRQAKRYGSAQGTRISWLMAIAHGNPVDRVRSIEGSGRRHATDCKQRCRLLTFDETSETAERLRNAGVVRDALSNLIVHQRPAIEPAHFCGHSHCEVARLVEVPLGVVKSRIGTGLIQLRASVDGCRHGAADSTYQ